MLQKFLLVTNTTVVGYFFFLLIIVQLYFDLLVKLGFKYLFSFQWSSNRNNVWFMKMLELDLFSNISLSYGIFAYLV